MRVGERTDSIKMLKEDIYRANLSIDQLLLVMRIEDKLKIKDDFTLETEAYYKSQNSTPVHLEHICGESKVALEFPGAVFWLGSKRQVNVLIRFINGSD